MLFGSTITGTDDGDNKDFIKEVVKSGNTVMSFRRREEQRLVGDRGNEIKDITAHFFALLKKYEAGEAQVFGIMADHLDPRTGKISRIKIITETQERN